MNRNEVVKILMYLRGAYGSQCDYPTYRGIEDTNTEDVWLDILGNYTFEAAMTAVKMLMQEGHEFPPKAPQIANACMEHSLPYYPTAEEALSIIQTICHEGERRASYNDYPKIIREVYTEMGGYRAIDDNFGNGAFRKEIRDLYNDKLKTIREEQRAHILSGKDPKELIGYKEEKEIIKTKQIEIENRLLLEEENRKPVELKSFAEWNKEYGIDIKIPSRKRR